MSISPSTPPHVAVGTFQLPVNQHVEACFTDLVLAHDALKRAIDGLGDGTRPNWPYVSDQCLKARAYAARAADAADQAVFAAPTQEMEIVPDVVIDPAETIDIETPPLRESKGGAA